MSGAPAAQRGAPLDVRQAYEAHFDWVWRTMRRLGVPSRDLEDVTHDVFVVVHRRAADYDPQRPMRPWLFGIAYRVASDHRKRKASAEWPSDELDRHAATAPGPDLCAERAESRDRVLEALDRLDLIFRAVVVCHDLDGLSAPEIAEALAIPLNTVYSRLRLGRAKLLEAVRHLLEALLAPEREVVGAPAEARGRVLRRLEGTLGLAPIAPPVPSAPVVGGGAGSGALATKLIGLLLSAAVLGGAAYYLRGGASRPVQGRAFVSPPIVAPPTPAPLLAPPPAPPPPDEATAPHDSPPRRPTHTPPPPSPVKQTPSTLREERGLLGRAQEALAQDEVTWALALLGEHRRRFPQGQLLEEREALAVRALVHAGQVEEAQEKARRFLAAHPDSLQRAVIDAALREAPP